VVVSEVPAVGLDDRDYMKSGHYPNCPCVACFARRAERPEENWCSIHKESKGQSDCWVCLLEAGSDRDHRYMSGRVFERVAAWRHGRIH
jgi:hypothetical protein